MELFTSSPLHSLPSFHLSPLSQLVLKRISTPPVTSQNCNYSPLLHKPRFLCNSRTISGFNMPCDLTLINFLSPPYTCPTLQFKVHLENAFSVTFKISFLLTYFYLVIMTPPQCKRNHLYYSSPRLRDNTSLCAVRSLPRSNFPLTSL